MRGDINNKNTKGEYHGYNEWYWGYTNGKLWVKRFYNNGWLIDYQEYYYYTGELEKSFYI